MTTPTSLAAVVQAGDVIRYEGQWRKVQAMNIKRSPNRASPDVMCFSTPVTQCRCSVDGEQVIHGLQWPTTV
ncbi:hypothetical protein [Streptomyces sp. NBC_00120]|uniref:hypothetical protein n=1 Tax=Streptomyces sp. NBC_00120 TaxID=2975660 RepID=UPI0022584725|nr:hypothetical protein [Streptomyces sp. NBC_00120]MCX5321246.1 hypothetical protein [Streptomyces sp. NBC_00120]